jgi:hypothetical protein
MYTHHSCDRPGGLLLSLHIQGLKKGYFSYWVGTVDPIFLFPDHVAIREIIA